MAQKTPTKQKNPGNKKGAKQDETIHMEYIKYIIQIGIEIGLNWGLRTEI